MCTGRVALSFPGQHPYPVQQKPSKYSNVGNETPATPLMNDVVVFKQPYLFLTRLKYIFDAPPVFMVYWLTGRLGPSFLVYDQRGKNSCVIGKKAEYGLKIRQCAFSLRSLSVFSWPEQSSCWPPLSWLFPREAEPSSGRLLAVQWGWSAASVKTSNHNIVDM